MRPQHSSHAPQTFFVPTLDGLVTGTDLMTGSRRGGRTSAVRIYIIIREFFVTSRRRTLGYTCVAVLERRLLCGNSVLCSCLFTCLDGGGPTEALPVPVITCCACQEAPAKEGLP